MTSERSKEQATKVIPYSGDLSDQKVRDRIVSDVAHALDSAFFEGIDGQKAAEFLRDVFDQAKSARTKVRD